MSSEKQEQKKEKEVAKKEVKKPEKGKAEKKKETKSKASEAKKDEPKKEAKAKEEKAKEKKAEGRVYTFNLREAYKKPRKKRAKTAVRVLRQLIQRHTKAAVVKISNALNAVIWKHSANKPPRKVKVKGSKEGNTAKAEPA